MRISELIRIMFNYFDLHLSHPFITVTNTVRIDNKRFLIACFLSHCVVNAYFITPACSINLDSPGRHAAKTVWTTWTLRLTSIIMGLCYRSMVIIIIIIIIIIAVMMLMKPFYTAPVSCRKMDSKHFSSSNNNNNKSISDF